MGERFRHLHGQAGRLAEVPFRERVLFPERLQPVGQGRPAGHQLLGDPMHPLGFPHPVHRHDPRVVLETPGPGLPLELEHRGFALRQEGGQHLDRHPPAQGDLLRLVHHPHAALAQFAEDAEIPDLLPGLACLQRLRTGHAPRPLPVPAQPLRHEEEVLELLPEGAPQVGVLRVHGLRVQGFPVDPGFLQAVQDLLGGDPLVPSIPVT